MDGLPSQEAVLRRFHDSVASAYGRQLARIVLFGSRARGEARADSDYDVAVFLHEMGDHWDEVRRLADITTDILIDMGAVISAKPFRVDGQPASTLSHIISRDGREV